MVSSDYRAEFNRWMSQPSVDEDTIIELSTILMNEKEKKSRFSGMMKFGTSGLRGLMRAGLNGMNVYTVRHATQGLASYILRFADGAERGVAIAFDSRNNSELYAIESACVLAANGIKVNIFSSLRPTPELSFAVRELNAIAGINITASHNPKEYNGYKVYWEDGAQLSLEAAEAVSDAIAACDIFEDVRNMDFRRGVSEGLINIIDDSFDERYVSNVLAQSFITDETREAAGNLKVVYTPFHGAGYRLVPEVLRRIGITDIVPVVEQMVPDGDFPTVKSPNPENTEGFALAMKYAADNDADIVIGTDPDSDRCGAVIRCGDEYRVLSGNQMGCLMLNYIIESRKAKGNLPSNAAAVKSIVSTKLANRICEANGVTMVEVLTGFKFIGEKIKEWESSGEYEFIFGFEESIGFLAGTYARDKDAVVAAMLMAEVAAFYKSKGMSVYDGLLEIYEKYGFYNETVKSYEFTGFDAQERMKGIMSGLRAEPPCSLGPAVTGVTDYLTDDTGLPSSDVLSYSLEGGSVAIIRPSGTEPKVKLYVMTKASSIAEGEEIKQRIVGVADELLK